MTKRDLLDRIEKLEARVAYLEAVAAARPAELEPKEPGYTPFVWWDGVRPDRDITWTVTNGTVQGPPRVVTGDTVIASPSPVTYNVTLDIGAVERAVPSRHTPDDLEL